MAYSTSNPPMLVTEAPLAAAGQIWRYSSVDPSATLDAAGYITNAKDLGMRVNDVVLAFDTTNNILSSHRVVSVNATTGVGDLGDGTVIGSATNTD